MHFLAIGLFGVAVLLSFGVGSWMAVARERERQAEAAAAAELAALPAETRVEQILPYLDRIARFDGKRLVTERLRQAPGAKRAVAGALRGGERMRAMEAADVDAELLDGEFEGDYWKAAAALADDLRMREVTDGWEAVRLERFVKRLMALGRKGGPVYAEEAVAVRRLGESGHGRLHELASGYLTRVVAR